MGRPKKDKRQLSLHASFGLSSRNEREVSIDINFVLPKDVALIENENEIENPKEKTRHLCAIFSSSMEDYIPLGISFNRQ